MRAKIGIRPAIDGRWGGIREGLEEQTMQMAKDAKKLIEENVFYADGSPAEAADYRACANYKELYKS